MKKILILSVLLPVFALVLLMACKKDEDTATAAVELPEAFKKFSATLQVYTEGDFVIIKTKAIPDHKSPYFATSDARYEAYNGTNPNFMLNPNRIIEQSLIFKIPAKPATAATTTATPLGPIGVSVNGVPLFNQYAGPNTPLTNEINSFDQYNGHPQQTGQYHYHVEPLFVTAQKGKNALIGFLLDGFPVYGPVENGTTLTSSSLDASHGHTTATVDYPNGIYHYHITADVPYINGTGFRGTAGTVTQ